MEIKRSIKGVRPFILSLFLVLTLATNVSATQVSDKSESVEIVEDKEDELMGTTKPSSFSRAALSIPAEGVYDTIKDTKNSAGVMIERRFYKSGKLTEKRTYTSTGSTDCRMRNKYLYYSDGATLERHRTYLNTGATCYNTSTKKYGVDKKIDWHLIYDGSKGYGKEGRFYDATGTYYTLIEYYTAGKKTSKNYWLGASGNRVTHVANMNSAGTEWQKATYYYDYTNKKVKQVINYNGKTPNLRTNETYYGTTGIKEWYRTYDSTGDLYHLTYYQANGVKKQEARYLKGTGVWTWDIKYQANGVDRESVRYRNEDNIYTRQLYYYAAGSKLKYDILYDEEGIKTSAKVYDEATQKITAQEEYVEGIISKETKYDDFDNKLVDTYYDEVGIIESKHIYVNNTLNEIIYLDEDSNIIEKSVYNTEGVIAKKNIYENNGISAIISYNNLSADDENIDTVIFYKTEEGFSGKDIVESKAFYDIAGNLIKEISYDEDGINELVVMHYYEDGRMKSVIDNSDDYIKSKSSNIGEEYTELEVSFNDENGNIVSENDLNLDTNRQNIIKGLEVVETMPDSVINKGEDAIKTYLSVNGISDETTNYLLKANVIDCALGIGSFILTNAFAPAKILKLKKALKAVGGAGKLAKKIVNQYKIYKKATKKVTTYIKNANGKKVKVVKKVAKYTNAQSIQKAINVSVRGAGKAAVAVLSELFSIASIQRGCFS